MKIKILGSGAAEGVPAVWCSCPTCKEAKVNKGKDLRRRASYLINDDTLIDFGPDIFWQSMEFGIDLTKIKRIFFTHAHEDHLNSVDFIWRKQGFSSISQKIEIYCNQNVVKKLEDISESKLHEMQISPKILHPGEVVKLDEIDILPVEAQHSSPDEQAFNFILFEAGKSILIANDTGWWDDESWEITKDLNLDAAILECTMGLNERYRTFRNSHLGADATVDFRNQLISTGALNPSAGVWATHFSHNGKCLQADLENFFIPMNILPVYDGLLIEL